MNSLNKDNPYNLSITTLKVAKWLFNNDPEGTVNKSHAVIDIMEETRLSELKTTNALLILEKYECLTSYGFGKTGQVYVQENLAHALNGRLEYDLFEDMYRVAKALEETGDISPDERGKLREATSLEITRLNWAVVTMKVIELADVLRDIGYGAEDYAFTDILVNENTREFVESYEEYLAKGSNIDRDEKEIERQNVKNQIANHKRRLGVLETQAAAFGPLHVPPHMLIEIEDTKKVIEALKSKSRNAHEIVSKEQLIPSLSEQIRDFREDRIKKIVNGEPLIPLIGNGRLVLHLLPLNPFSSNVKYDVNQLRSNLEALRTIVEVPGVPQNNIDGLLSISKVDYAPISESYVQFYNSGIVEAVDAFILNYEEAYNRFPTNVFPVDFMESRLLKAIPRYLKAISELGVTPPIWILVSLTGIRGAQLALSFKEKSQANSCPVDRNILKMPEVLVEDLSINFQNLMRPIFDSLWNSVGLEGSENYDKDGKWTGLDI